MFDKNAKNEKNRIRMEENSLNETVFDKNDKNKKKQDKNGGKQVK